MGIQVTDSVWPSPRPLDWGLLDRAPLLALRAAPGTDPFGETMVIELTAAVTAAYQAIYGGRVASAVQIVAIDTESGRVYVGTPDENGAVPLPAVMHLDPARPATAPPFPTASILYVDLAWQLGLPAKGANYSVFLWLDDLVSGALSLEVPTGPQRPWQPGKAAGEGQRAVTVGGPAAPGMPGPISLQLDDSAGVRRVLRGAVDVGALRLLRPKVERPVLTVLALDFLTRQVAFESVAMSGSAAGPVSFTVELNRLLPIETDAGRGTVFVVAHMNGQTSPVLVVPLSEHESLHQP